MAKGKSDRRGAANAQDPQPISKSVLFGPDDLGELDANDYRYDSKASNPDPEGVSSLDRSLPNYKDALASVADRYLSKSSESQTPPDPDPPQSGSQTPDKSDEARPVSPSPKHQGGRARRLSPGQWVTK